MGREMIRVKRILHIEAGNQYGKNVRRGCDCGYGYGDAACGGDYVCSCFRVYGGQFENKDEEEEEGKEWTIDLRLFVCTTMQGIEASGKDVQEALLFYTFS